jgi:hypothetical protein
MFRELSMSSDDCSVDALLAAPNLQSSNWSDAWFALATKMDQGPLLHRPIRTIALWNGGMGDY